MDIKYFCPRWGSEDIPWEAFFQKIKGAGYDGVEYAIDNDVSAETLDEVFSAAARSNVLLIAQHYATNSADFDRHFEAYEGWLRKVLPFKPLLINSQTGKDYFSFEQNKSLIDLAVDYSIRSGVVIYHETHRGKFSFAAHITAKYLEKIPYLQLTLDASHWVNVAESYLEDQAQAVSLAISRTHHVHARVGHTEGPQVTDPRDPQWATALEAHLRWWDQVVEKKRMEDDKVLTITMEFGPWPYLTVLPFSHLEVAGQWEVNEYMLGVLRGRYQRL